MPKMVAPYTGAWIEILVVCLVNVILLSHPTRVRGLKFRTDEKELVESGRTLHGCVD